MSITEIGIVAGEIWQHLDKHDSAPLEDLVKSIEKPRDMVLMSLGWLAREGHVTLVSRDQSFVVTLNRSKSESS